MEMLKLEKEVKFYLIKSFTLGLLLSFMFFIPYIIFDKGYLLYYGDFNVQEIPFYKLAHDAVKKGDIFWNFNTDLGANFIGSYSFYMLGSPFFWLTLPFSNDMVPYLMGPLLMLKFGFSTLFSFLYLSRYIKNYEFALIGALLYSFSGFSIYNIFFNHFHEAIVIFPLLLYSFDELVYKKRRCIFAFCVFLSCIMNYYFFVGQVVFLVIYWIIKIVTHDIEFDCKEFIYLCIEAIMGLAMSSFLLFPALLSAIQNTRVKDFLFGFDTLLYTPTQRYLHIIESFFFLPDIPAQPNFTPDSQADWSSISAYLPFLSMTGVIAYLKEKKRNWLRFLIIILFIMAMVPILNSTFQLFNQVFYTRWFYMLTLMMSLATVIALENQHYNLLKSSKITLIVTLVISICIAFIPKKVIKNNETQLILGLMAYKDRFWIYVSISILSLAFFIILLNFRSNIGLFSKLLLFSVSFFIVFSTTYIIYIGKTNQEDTDSFVIPYALNGKKNINLPDTKYCRCDVYDGMDNQAMFWDIPTIQAFHSVVPGSIMEFYPTIGVTRDVASRPDLSLYGLRALTSCRWWFKHCDENTSDFQELPGFEYYDKQNGFDVFENKYFIPFGFSYDSYITRSEYDLIDENLRHLVLLKTMVIEDEIAEQYESSVKHVDNINEFKYNKDEYFLDCLNRKKVCCTDFEYDSYGMSAVVNVPDMNSRFIFFSVPWESGWSVYVNDIKSDIIKANVGFMAVLVPGGQISKIKFNYVTPGLLAGIVVSAIGLTSYLIYLFQLYKRKLSKKL